MEENKDTAQPEQDGNKDVLAEQQMAQEAGISVSIGALIYSLLHFPNSILLMPVTIP